MADEVYKQLRAFYDKLPGGFPETDTGVEIKILKKMFNPEEAKIVLHMSAIPEPAFEIARRTGEDAGKVLEKLNNMADRNIIFRLPAEENPHFLVINFLIGAWEGQIWTKADREFAELVNEYLPNLAKVWSAIKTQQTRVVPVNSAVSSCFRFGSKALRPDP